MDQPTFDLGEQSRFTDGMDFCIKALERRATSAATFGHQSIEINLGSGAVVRGLLRQIQAIILAYGLECNGGISSYDKLVLDQHELLVLAADRETAADSRLAQLCRWTLQQQGYHAKGTHTAMMLMESLDCLLSYGTMVTVRDLSGIESVFKRAVAWLEKSRRSLPVNYYSLNMLTSALKRAQAVYMIGERERIALP